MLPPRSFAWSIPPARKNNGSVSTVLTSAQSILSQLPIFSMQVFGHEIYVTTGENGVRIETESGTLATLFKSGGKKNAHVILARLYDGSTMQVSKTANSDLTLETAAVTMSIAIGSTLFLSSALKNRDQLASGAKWCRTPPGMVGYPHDDICSFGPKSGNWTFWFPCAGTFTVNIDSCCKNHDKMLYCSKNFLRERLLKNVSLNVWSTT